MEQSLLKKIAQKSILKVNPKSASDLELKESLGPSSYQEEIVATTPIGRSLKEMVEDKVSMVLFIVLLKSCCE